MSLSDRGQPLFDGGPSYSPSQLYTPITDTAATDIITGTPPNGGKWILDDIILSADADTNVLIQDNTGTPIVLFRVDLTGGIPAQFTPRDGFRLAGAGKKLQAKSANAVNLRVFASAHEEAA